MIIKPFTYCFERAGGEKKLVNWGGGGGGKACKWGGGKT